MEGRKNPGGLTPSLINLDSAEAFLNPNLSSSSMAWGCSPSPTVSDSFSRRLSLGGGGTTTLASSSSLQQFDLLSDNLFPHSSPSPSPSPSPAVHGRKSSSSNPFSESAGDFVSPAVNQSFDSYFHSNPSGGGGDLWPWIASPPPPPQEFNNENENLNTVNSSLLQPTDNMVNPFGHPSDDDWSSSRSRNLVHSSNEDLGFFLNQPPPLPSSGQTSRRNSGGSHISAFDEDLCLFEDSYSQSSKEEQSSVSPLNLPERNRTSPPNESNSQQVHYTTPPSPPPKETPERSHTPPKEDNSQQAHYASSHNPKRSTEYFSPPQSLCKEQEEEQGEEFIGAEVVERVFKPPVREAVCSDRPVPLELRPHPLKEPQANQPSGVLACTDTAVWLSREHGIMVWDIESARGPTADHQREFIVGDEDAAASILLPVHGTVTTCIVPDVSNSVVWSGHKDGTVRAWPLNLSFHTYSGHDSNAAILIFPAHRTPIMSMVITSYGELWTGSENGAVRAWPWESINRALHSGSHSGLSASSLIADSYIDLRSHGAAAGASMLLNEDTRFLLAEHAIARVWSGGLHMLGLWDARTRDILKVFGLHGPAEFSSPDIPPVRENTGVVDNRPSFAKPGKKEKGQGSLNFFQRSRNAVFGAADAVLRAAVGGQNSDDGRNLEAIVAASDGTVWASYAGGLLVVWDKYGNRLHEQQLVPVIATRCMCTFGTRVWAGYADGRVRVFDLNTTKLLGTWRAHRSVAVLQVGVCGDHVFTLASDGGVRGWNLASPSPLDDIMQFEMHSRENLYTQHETLRILAGTWNVSQEKPNFKSLSLWLSERVAKASIVVIGLQEMEMGAGILAMAAAKETVGLEGSAGGQSWLENIGNAIGGSEIFVRVASRQLAGLLVGAWVRTDLRKYVGDVDVGAVACGFGRAFGNKGAVAVKMSVFRRIICVVNCHLAAHMDAVSRRNADFDYIFRKMMFGRSSGGVGVAATSAAASAVQMMRRRAALVTDSQEMDSEMDVGKSIADADLSGECMLSEADLLLWFGDCNYRIDEVSYEEAVDTIKKKSWDSLLKNDQLRVEMMAGRVFQGMREGCIKFAPTYKFDKGSNWSGFPLGYDSSEKKRVPAWCDRILFRDSFEKGNSGQDLNLSQPVHASVYSYDACMDLTDSDHKPVSGMFLVELKAINEALRRQEYGKLFYRHTEIQAFLNKNNKIPETVVNTNYLCLEDRKVSSLRITNECIEGLATFDIFCEGEPTGNFCPCKKSHSLSGKRGLRGLFGLPPWLQVLPGKGVLKPGETIEILFRACEDSFLNELNGGQEGYRNETESEKVVVIVINIKGCLSAHSRKHKVCVCHRRMSNPARMSQDNAERTYLNRSGIFS